MEWKKEVEEAVTLERRRSIMLGILLIVAVSVLLLLFVPNGVDREPVATDAIGVVQIHGQIADAGDGPLATVTNPRNIQAQLRQARLDDGIRAVLIRINSGGGTVAASQEIAEEVRLLTNDGKPVVVSMGDVAGSGAYLVAAQADEILAMPGTMTGGIGALIRTVSYAGLYEMLGIDVEVIRSGEHKDLGAPHRSLTDEERRLLQDMIDDVHNQFVEAVADGRGLSRETVEGLADGRIFTGQQALDRGLIDGFANFNEAVERTAELAELDVYRVVPMEEPSPMDRLLRAIFSQLGPMVFELLGVPAPDAVYPAPELQLE